MMSKKLSFPICFQRHYNVLVQRFRNVLRTSFARWEYSENNWFHPNSLVMCPIHLLSRGITPTKMRGSKFPDDMHNYIWCPIYIPSYVIIGSVVSEELRLQDFGTDGRTDGRSECTPRPAFAFGDASNKTVKL